MSIGTIYLTTATALLFGACFFAARKAFPRLTPKQVALIALIALLMARLIWILLSFATKWRDNAPISPTTEPTQLVQPNPN